MPQNINFWNLYHRVLLKKPENCVNLLRLVTRSISTNSFMTNVSTTNSELSHLAIASPITAPALQSSQPLLFENSSISSQTMLAEENLIRVNQISYAALLLGKFTNFSSCEEWGSKLIANCSASIRINPLDWKNWVLFCFLNYHNSAKSANVNGWKATESAIRSAQIILNGELATDPDQLLLQSLQLKLILADCECELLRLDESMRILEEIQKLKVSSNPKLLQMKNLADLIAIKCLDKKINANKLSSIDQPFIQKIYEILKRNVNLYSGWMVNFKLVFLRFLSFISLLHFLPPMNCSC